VGGLSGPGQQVGRGGLDGTNFTEPTRDGAIAGSSWQ